MLAYLAGIWLSMVFDYPTGALIVWAMAVFAVAGAWVFAGLARRVRTVGGPARFQEHQL